MIWLEPLLAVVGLTAPTVICMGGRSAPYGKAPHTTTSHTTTSKPRSDPIQITARSLLPLLALCSLSLFGGVNAGKSGGEVLANRAKVTGGRIKGAVKPIECTEPVRTPAGLWVGAAATCWQWFVREGGSDLYGRVAVVWVGPLLAVDFCGRVAVVCMGG